MTDVEDVVVLVVGLVFHSEDEISNYYREYTNKVGFGVVKKSVGNENGLQYFSLCCSRYGKFETSSSNPCPTKAANCPAKINVKVSREGKYTISKVVLEHNHDVSLGKSCRFRSNQTISMQARRSLETNDEAGIRMNKSYSTMIHEAGGHEHMTFGESQGRTYIQKTRLELGLGYAEVLQQYFTRLRNLDLETRLQAEFSRPVTQTMTCLLGQESRPRSRTGTKFLGLFFGW